MSQAAEPLSLKLLPHRRYEELASPAWPHQGVDLLQDLHWNYNVRSPCVIVFRGLYRVRFHVTSIRRTTVGSGLGWWLPRG